VTPLYARHKRTTLAIATAVAAGALLATGMTTGASAQTQATPGGSLQAAKRAVHFWLGSDEGSLIRRGLAKAGRCQHNHRAQKAAALPQGKASSWLR